MSINPSTLIIIVIIILLVFCIDNRDNRDNRDNCDNHISLKVQTEDLEHIESVSPNTTINIDMNPPPKTDKYIDTRKLQIITAGLGPEVRRLGELESQIGNMEVRQNINTNVLEKLYKRDVLGDYMTRGWFVQIHDVISTPHGVTLGAEIDRMYGIRRICFRAQNNYPFLGIPQDPMYLPKAEFVGFRAMTIFKIPKTGYYDFKLLSDDGSRLMYQVVDSDVMMNEKNVRDQWKVLIDQWQFQAETWKMTQKLYFNQSDLVLLRFDYFQADANSTACIKVRYSETDDNSNDQNINSNDFNDFNDFNTGDLYCSLLWTDVPTLGK